ncbi:MAG: redoxin family protein [Deltaproteobacteria bacterium]|nr:redoxin family protein [Deltaproteobacteria bacterium]
MRLDPILWAVSLGLLTMAAGPASAGDAVVELSARVTPERLGPNDKGKLEVRIEVPSGWHLWSLDPGEGPMALTLAVEGPLATVGAWMGPAPKRAFDRGFGRELASYGDGTLILERVVTPRGGVEGPGELTVRLRGQICTEEQCVVQRLTAKASFALSNTPLGVGDPALGGVALSERGPAPSFGAVGSGSPTATPAAPEPEPTARVAPAFGSESDGLWSFLLVAVLAGFGALLTPCVFPAVPMTVSFFSKFSSDGAARATKMAAVYAVSMMGFFTLGGVAASMLFGVTGIQRFAAHPAFNLFLGLVLAFFALSLLGMFKLELPASVMIKINELERRVGVNEASTKGVRDYVAVAVAAMSATLVFFTCTVGFVGVVLVAAARGEWIWPTLGMLAFSATFSLPFFLLALFPQRAQALRGKSGEWLVLSQVTLGFLELAASTKFFSNADLVLGTNMLSRDAVLALWVALFALAGWFLLGKLQLAGVTGGEAISVPRMLAAAATFAFALYLSVGLFAGRPLGGWVDGWLPPAELPGAPMRASSKGSENRLRWVTHLAEGRKRAAESGTLVFINYTGYTCTNCRYMESGVFTRPEIFELLSAMTLIELYTDGGTPENDQNRDDQVARFSTAALPFYVVERPDGTVIATFPSSTNDPEQFRRFLADSVAKGTQAAAPATVDKRPWVLPTTRLSDGAPEPAVAVGRWTLVNFWATWCTPCREELEGFLAKSGLAVEAQGGRFALVAIEEDDTIADAKAYSDKLGLDADSALRLGPEAKVDERLGFDGSALPFTTLISPDGRVVFKKQGKLEKEELDKVLLENLGLALAP